MPKTLDGGFLIVFDGIDGAGKSTQIQLTTDALAKAGWSVLSRRNMGGTPIGEELREVIKGPNPRPAETDMYISAAVQAALIEQINKDREAGHVILMDRGPLSLAAYEMYGSGLDSALCKPHVDEGMAKLRPNLTIIYKANVQTSLERAKQHAEKLDYFEQQPLDYFERVSSGYDQLAGMYPNVTTIDAEQPIDQAHEATMKLVEETLAKFS